MSSSSSNDLVTESVAKKRKAEGKIQGPWQNPNIILEYFWLHNFKKTALEMEKEEVGENQKVVENYGEEEDPSEDSICCNICFEPWSNTGSHRISSLKCGHFFGLSCIEKWLNSTGGNDCPTCNEKATKRDIRHHYVAKLKAIDTGDRDRAIEQVDSLKKELRKVELESAQMKVILFLNFTF